MAWFPVVVLRVRFWQQFIKNVVCTVHRVELSKTIVHQHRQLQLVDDADERLFSKVQLSTLIANRHISGKDQHIENRKSLKFKSWPKIQRVRVNNFRASGSILTKLFQSTCRKAGVITLVQVLQGSPQKICDGKISSKIRRDF